MPVVAIVGKPNVGKSALFNRLIGKRMAIVDDVPGVTRDRLYGQVEHEGKSFYIVDTGGLFVDEDHPLMEMVKKQVLHALDEADLVLLVIDGKEGTDFLDEEVANLVRKHKKPIITVVNKIDDPKLESEYIAKGYSLGFKDVVGVSAEHNWQIDELLDMIINKLPQQEKETKDEQEIKVAIIGRPNVGKSSILNVLLGEERSIVSDIPGTTRDMVDSQVIIEDTKYRFIDTAGIRRKSRISEDVEYYSVVRALRAIERADVVLLVLDGTEPATSQDKKLAEEAIKKGKGIIIVVNKWDIVPKSYDIGGKFIKYLENQMWFIDFAPILFVSAKTGRNIKEIPKTIKKVWENRRKRLKTSQLNRLIRDVLSFERFPSDGKGRYLKIYYCSQVGINPPTFVFFVNDPELVKKPFERMIEKKIREIEDFTGTPIRIYWRKSGKNKN